MDKEQAIAMGFQVAGQEPKITLYHKPTRLAINVQTLSDETPENLITQVFNAGKKKR